MTRRSLQTLTGGVLVLALLVMGAGFPTKQVPPKKWAKSVCTAIGDWVDAAKTGATALQTKTAGQGANIPKVRKALVAYLGDTVDSTSKVGDKLEHAGTPDTPKGKEAAKVFQSGFKNIEKAIAKFKHEAKGVSTANPTAALADLQALQVRINTRFGTLTDAFQKLSKLDPNHKLQKAFEATQACRALSG